MAEERTLTMLKDLVNPEVMAPIVSYEMENALRFTPIAQVDDTLQGNPGDTLTFPQFTYMGDAKDIPEGEAIPLDKIGTKTTKMTIKKAAKGTEFTDESYLSGLGDVVGEHQKQLGIAIANKVENDVIDASKTGTQKVTIEATVEGINTAMDIYNEEEDGVVVALMNPKTASKVRYDAIQQKINTDVGANELIKGTYADILGVQLVRTRRLAENEAIFIKTVDPEDKQARPALKLLIKRDINAESDRDITRKTTIMTADKIYGAYLYDDSKVIVATVGGDKPATPSKSAKNK
ncbi:N4-gp56 family major capsid protein [Lactobacillus terrae]|uniref:N4-gp56 family major capsid protein n=1 Tax=Lactobacillus terrae TaxID=2269374 RepID=UPI000C1B7C1D|nr:N4-gp56 family major capsid protein [Lactobacillus terrae]